jgi:hypothetical protein
MLSAEDGREARHVDRTLASAQKIIAGVQYRWLVSRSDESLRARPMGAFSRAKATAIGPFGF